MKERKWEGQRKIWRLAFTIPVGKDFKSFVRFTFSDPLFLQEKFMIHKKVLLVRILAHGPTDNKNPYIVEKKSRLPLARNEDGSYAIRPMRNPFPRIRS